MAKPPPSLIRHLGVKIDENSPDEALVKVRTLKAWMARIISMIPSYGSGMQVRKSLFGDIWSAAGSAPSQTPFGIDAAGKVYPGLVGLRMPTLGGSPLDTTTNVLDLSADGDLVYFKLNFTTYWVESYLASWTLDSVSVEQGSALPTEDADTKYLWFNYISGGAAGGPSFFNQSINVRLLDNGISATRLEYNP